MPLPDLTGYGLTLSTTTVSAGGFITLSGTIQNIGTATATNFEYGVYLSTDTVFDPNTDILLGGDIGITLGAGQSLSASGTVSLPSNLASGTYYLGVYVDDTFVVTESDETNNVVYQAITVQAAGGADLTGTGLTLSETVVAPGDVIIMEGTIQNTGTDAATNFEYGVYISTDPVIDPNTDLLIGGDIGVTVGAGQSLPVSGNVTIPSTLAPGTYYIGVYLDDTFVVPESDETNNVVLQTITVQNSTRASVTQATYPTGNALLDGLIYDGSHWTGPSAGTTTITVYLSDYYKAWNSIEIAAINAAMAAWEAVANIDFQIVLTSYQANFVEYVVPSSVQSALGSHYLPAPGTSQVSGYYNYEGLGWDETDPNGGLVVGGYGYLTLVHELGHGLGLEHPHDGTLFPGVTVDTDLGSNQLNQGIYTVMSYNDGWASFQDPAGNGLISYGYNAGPSALDIAAVQALYGANPNRNAGNDTYVLPDANGIGTYWTAIWDTGGKDSIVYNGNRDATIDLRPATLRDEQGGGGFPSWASGIYGGYTIANGVVIENAVGGAGNDTIWGNDAANVLKGNDGNDQISGGAGNDILFGGLGNDTLSGGDGNDWMSGEDGNDQLIGGLGNDTLKGGLGNDSLQGDDGDDKLKGLDGDDSLVGGSGADILYGYAGSDTLDGGVGNDWLYGGSGGDSLRGGDGDDRLNGNRHNDTLFGDAGNDTLKGGGGNDTLSGGVGDDYLLGENGNDILRGDAGSDRLWGGDGLDRFVHAPGFGTDTVKDFTDGDDRIDLTSWNFADAAAALAYATQTSWGAVKFDFSTAPGGSAGDILYVTNMTLGVDFTAADIIV